MNSWFFGDLGFLIADEAKTADGIGRFSVFQHGSINSHPQHGAHPVSGTIFYNWFDSGAEAGPLGYPIADPIHHEDIWYNQQFVGGTLSGTVAISQKLYWPLTNAYDLPSQTTARNVSPVEPGENYETRFLPCINYELAESVLLAEFKVAGMNGRKVSLSCGRFRTHMAPNPEATGAPGHFANYPPTRADWYNFLGCAGYTFNGEVFFDADDGHWGRQRMNTRPGIKSVMLADDVNRFVTGWAGLD
ncbi:hypothetical protein GCM10027595_05910 [Corynebacterium nasicanis]